MIPAPPDFIKDDSIAVEYWRSLYSKFKPTQNEKLLYGMLCLNLSLVQQCTKAFSDDGLLLSRATGAAMPHPLTGTFKNCSDSIVKISTAMGKRDEVKKELGKLEL